MYIIKICGLTSIIYYKVISLSKQQLPKNIKKYNTVINTTA